HERPGIHRGAEGELEGGTANRPRLPRPGGARERSETERHSPPHGGGGRAARRALGEKTDGARGSAAGIEGFVRPASQSLVESRGRARRRHSPDGSGG